MAKDVLNHRVMNPVLAEAETLPSSWYTNPGILSEEKTKVFYTTWQLVAKQSDLSRPGDFLAVELVGEPLLLTRDREGTLRGFYNVCRHRAGPVALGCGNRKALQCRYHGWTYGLDGQLLTTREMEGTQSFDKNGFGLVPIQVDTWGPFVFVNLDPDAPPFAETFQVVDQEVKAAGFDLSRLVPVERRDYDIACNWKVYVDNYLEGYHVPIVHPGLFRELDYDRYEVRTYARYSKQFAPVRPAAGEGSRPYARYADQEADALYYWIFPNLMLNILPDNMSTNVILPSGHDRTLTIFEWFFNSEARPEDIRQTVDFSDEIQQEDIFICEQVQIGLQSQSYQRGRYCVQRENGVHHFHLLMEDALR